MKKVVLKMEIPPQSWIKHILDIPGITEIKILDCHPSDDGTMNEFFEIHCTPEAMHGIIKNLMNTPGVKDLETTLKTSSGKIVGSLKTTQCNLCKHFSSSECFLGSALYELKKGKIRWSFYVREKYLPKIFNALEKEGIAYDVEENSTVSVAGELTSFQKRLLEQALQEGYLDVPRRANSNKLAAELGITKTSLSITLRRALKKAVMAYLEQTKT